MQAYRSNDLYNKIVIEQASDAFLAGAINEDPFKKIIQSHRSALYTPNYFIRIAMAVLSAVAVLFSSALLGVVFHPDSTAAIIMLMLFMALLCYGCLELFVKEKRYYNAGIDNLLMLAAAGCITGTFLVTDYWHQNLAASGAAILICLWMTLRFTDAFMAMLAYVALMVFVYFFYTGLGSFAMATVPLVLMMVSAILHFAMTKLQKKETLLFYHSCCKWVLVLTLFSFYASGNYFIVKELGDSLFGVTDGASSALPFGWLFWIFTVAIPPAYIVYGIVKKNLVFIRTGLVLIAAAVFTVRYYYDIMSAELLMFIAGTLLVAIGYALIKALHTPRLGFTANKPLTANKDVLNIEALIIAQTFAKGTAAENSGVQFGGGSGGGGGATGNY